MFRKIRPDLLLAFIFGTVFIAVILMTAIKVESPSALLITVIKIVLALSAAGVAALIPGFLDLNISPTTNTAIRAGGAIAVFVLVFFFTPAGLVEAEPPLPPPPASEPEAACAEWLNWIDRGDYQTAYEHASTRTKTEYSRQFFERIFNEQRKPLGKVEKRQLYGATSATTLPNGRRGTFRIITYQTKFSSGSELIEMVIVSAEDGKWKVTDHSIYPKPPQPQ